MLSRNVRRLALRSSGYRRDGYVVQVVGSDGGDGGVDIELTGPGATILVQCKQWRAAKVGVTTVRELLGVVVSRRASKGILVTSGRFTDEALAFAQANPAIELVDGPALTELIRSVQSGGKAELHGDAPLPGRSTSAAPAPRCPQCGSPMRLRTARQGPNAGSQFWGCPKYPACRGMRPYAAVESAQHGT